MAESINYNELLAEACKKNGFPESTQKLLSVIPWDEIAALGVNVQKDLLRNKDNLERMAYDHPTHLVNAKIKNDKLDFSGDLQILVKHLDDKVTIKTRGKIAEPSLKLFGEEIYSQKAIENLLEKAVITTNKGNKVNGYVNANAGFPIASTWKDKNGEEHTNNYFVSIDPETNHLDAVDVRLASAYIDAQKQMYGVALSDEQRNDLKQGKAVVLFNCKTKDEKGKEKTFNCAVQYNATTGRLAPCQPKWLKEVIRNTNNQAVVETKPEVKAEKAEAKKTVKKAAPKAAKTEEPKKKTGKKIN